MLFLVVGTPWKRPRRSRLCCPDCGDGWFGGISSTRTATLRMRLRNSCGSVSSASSTTLSFSLPSPSSSSSSSASSGSCRRRTSAAIDRSEGSESGHSGCILLMFNGTPRSLWQLLASLGGALERIQIVMPILKAGVLYFALVFGAGFVLDYSYTVGRPEIRHEERRTDGDANHACRHHCRSAVDSPPSRCAVRAV